MTVLKFMASAVVLATSCAAFATPAKLRLGPQGEILGWLMAGPFPNVGALERKGTGFATDYLGGEGKATAKEGERIPMIPAEKETDPHLTVKRKAAWQLGVGTTKKGIDLGRLLNGSKPAVGYVYTELHSPRAMQAKLLLGSDDGAKVWLNGELKFSKQIARGIKRDEDVVAIHLNKGTNRLLFKIEQGDGDWGLIARITSPEGKPILGLTQSLDLTPNGPEVGVADKWIRQAIGKPGSLDIDAALDYEENSRRAALWVGRFEKEAADPAKLEATIAGAKDNLGHAFGGSADALSDTLRAAGDKIQAQYDRSRAPLLKKTQAGEPLVITQVESEDYAKVMPEGRYFVHADGKPLIPIGYNHNPDWAKFEEANPLGNHYEPELPDQYMAHLQKSGVNVIRLMIETPPSGNLEEPIGTFSPEHVRWIDTIFLAARKHGIKLIVTPWDTFWMNRRWETTPYNPENGGLVHKRIDFITSPEVRAQQKKRLKFLIDRWGNTGTIFSWELLNEADLWWGANAQQLTEWVDDMTVFVRTYEQQKWGRNHMLSVSFAEPMPKGDMAHLAFTSPRLDYLTTHLYIGASKAPTESVGPALAINQGVSYAVGQVNDNAPYMDTENGPIDKWIADPVLDAEVFHNVTWAHLASGGAGSGFRWPYRHPHHLTEGMLLHLKHLSTFVAGVDWTALSGDREGFGMTFENTANAFGIATGKSVLAWCLGRTPLAINWDGPDTVTCRRFDTKAGTWLPDVTVTKTKGSYVIPPSDLESVAVVLVRK